MGIRCGALCALGLGLFAGACSGNSEVANHPPHQDAGTDATAFCSSGQYQCNGNVAEACDGKGGISSTVDCSKGGQQCSAPYGCVICNPGTGSCANGSAKVCRPDGSGFDTFDCDPLQGMTCDPGGCKGACAPPGLADSYLGCDYYPTVTPNPVWSGFDFTVAVANAGTASTTVHVTRGATDVKSVPVAAGALALIKLPWVPELKGGDVDACQKPPDPGATRIVKSGAYRLRTDQPVTVYQLSPLEYQLDPVPSGCPLGKDCPGGFGSECLSFSNDASLLLPATALTGDYTAVAWPSTSTRAGFIAVTATRDGTQVKLLGTGAFAAGGGIDATGNGTVTLDRGDVLLALAQHGGSGQSYGPDISGTRVTATAPVQVVSGQSCANVPTATADACDHIEHAMLPAETLGKDYLVTFPAGLGPASPQVVRVAAIEKDTTVSFDPPVHASATLGPGVAPLELDNVTQDFRVTADKPILVTQYMQSQSSVPSASGDPSLAVVVPTAQYRKSYLFVASKTYDTSFVNVVAKTGTAVTLDGQAVPTAEFSAIGGSGYSVARHELDPTDVHTIESAGEFGIVVYGYGRYTSYMYPGGLDLQRIAPPPIY